MSDSGEILETTEDGRFRVRIVSDDDPSEPYDDGGSPILQYSFRHHWEAEQVDKITSFVVPDEIIVALQQWGGETEKFERYLRIFHGTTSIVWATPHRSGPDYVTFDTAAWREAMGLSDEYIAAHPEHFADNKLANMDEYVAYLEGDVYGYIVEKRVVWTTEDDFDDRTSWEDLDSCWGFYGYTDYLKDAAREALHTAAETSTKES